jgi:hypothetical protein
MPALTMLRPRIVHALLAATAAAIVLHAAISGCDHDEVEHLHAAWLVSQGERPFVDFLEQHHPATWYLLAPLARALEERPRAFAFAARCLDLGLIGLTIAAFTAMARRLLRDRSAAWPPLLLAGCFLFLRESMEVRPDPWMAALAAVALWQWTGFLRGGGLASAALAGLALGGSIVFLQKAVAFAALLALGTVFVAGRDFFRTLKGGAVLTVCAAVPVGILALHARPAFREFWFWNYTFNRYYYLQTTFPRPSAWETLGKAVFEDLALDRRDRRARGGAPPKAPVPAGGRARGGHRLGPRRAAPAQPLAVQPQSDPRRAVPRAPRRPPGRESASVAAAAPGRRPVFRGPLREGLRADVRL